MKKYYLYFLIFPNNKIYIGISFDPDKRFIKHKSHAKTGSNLPVHQAINKYGSENVKQKIVCVGTKEYIANLEIKMIAIKKTQDREFGVVVHIESSIVTVQVHYLLIKTSFGGSNLPNSFEQFIEIVFPK